MATQSTANILAARMAQFKQSKDGVAQATHVFEPVKTHIIIKPTPSNWEEL